MYHLVKLAGLELELYNGDMVDGKREGFGTQIFPNGYKYTGEWKKNLAHGKGKLEYTDGTFYEGEFNKNRIQEGLLSFINGTRYAGKFCMDERNKDKFAEGSIVFRNGDVFKGVWSSGIPKSGTYINKQGVMKNYNKENDFFDYDDTDGGYGKQILVNTEDVYEGGFKEGKQEGPGFIFSTYPHYETFHILNGKLHGKYICNYISGGYCYEGMYEHGKRVGKWKYQTVKGYFFEGDPDFKTGNVMFPFMNEDYFTGDVDIKFQNITFKSGVFNYKDSSGRYHQIHVKEGKVVGDKEIRIAKLFNFDQVAAKLDHSRIHPDKPVLNGEHTYHYPDGFVFTGNLIFDFIYVHKDDLPKCYKKARMSDLFQPVNIDIRDVYRFSNQDTLGIKEKKFKGSLADGVKEGYCEIEYSNGSIFKGNFVHGVRTGNGLFKDHDGTTLIGDYSNDIINGTLMICKPNGDEIQTVAINGIVSGENAMIKKKNGLIYQGQIKNLVKNGYGVLTYANNYSLKSHFKDSEIDTSKEKAVLTDPEGKISYCTYTNLEGRAIGILENNDDGTVYVYNMIKGTLQKAQ